MWAYPLARELRQRWTWLREAPLPRVAATLGATLGPDWSAQDLIGWVHRQRPQRLLEDPRDAVAYLRAVLRDALDTPAVPPHPARRHTEQRRALAAAQAHAQRAHADAVRAERDERTRAAVAPGQRTPATEAMLAALRARTPEHRRGTAQAARAAQPGGAPAAATRGHDAARAVASAEDWPEWPPVAQPGAGLTPNLRP